MTVYHTPQEATARQLRSGLLYIALATPFALGIWLAVSNFAPPLVDMETFGARMLFTLKCCSAAALFCFVLGIEAVAHERLTSPAFDPLSGFETRRLRVNLRYLQNTLEQFIVFAVGLFGLASYSANGSSMRTVEATTIVWILARFAFWIGYQQSAAMRGLGAPGVMMSLLVLLYVVARFGYELAGLSGAVAPVVAFLLIEAFLFWATRPLGDVRGRVAAKAEPASGFDRD